MRKSNTHKPSAADDVSPVRTTESIGFDDSWQVGYIIAAHTKAAERGFPEAQNELGIRFYVGDCVERNRATALDWFEKAAAQGNADACYNLGVCHAYGQPSEINYSVAVDYFKWAANLGSLEAARALVDFYSPAKWTQKDVHEVVKWFRMLCRRDPKAMEMKRPVSPQYQDDPEYYEGACHWLGIASDAGVKEAQYFEARSDYDGVIYERSLGSDARFAADRDRKARRAFALFRSSSERGWLPSLKCLGDCYMEAVGVEKNISEAVRLYRLAAEKGYAPAQKALADIYYAGDAVKKDLQKAIDLYEKAAAQDNANAQYFLGLCYFTGDGVEKDMGKAWMLLTRAAYGRVEEAYEVRHVVETLVTPQERAKWDEGRRMNPFSRQHSLDELRKWMYDNNYPIGYVEPYSRDYDWRKMAADLGNAKALCDIGVDLVENPTSDADWDRAFKLFTRAADLGEPSAFFNMGKCLMDGIGTEVDKVRGLAWFEKAWNFGYKSVQPFLADCYLDGIGCKADADKAIDLYKRNLMPPNDRPKEAFCGVECHKLNDGRLYYQYSPARRWIQLMAESGDAECQYSMGLELAVFSTGWREKKESQEAFSWFLKAAEQGYTEAENQVGECYRDGHGVEPDMSEAVRWFEKAAGQNNPRALFNLGFYYYAGNGVRRDWKKARELLERAVEADKDGWRAGDKAKECLRDMGVEVQSCRSQEQVTMKPDENEEVSCSGRDGPPSALAPPDSTRPDGKPWLTKAQILDLLEQTLCLRDKARVQRTPEDAARKCMLCWLAHRIENELEIEAVPHNTGGQRLSVFSRTRILYRNPNVPQGRGTMHSGVRDCDLKTCNRGFDENSWRKWGKLSPEETGTDALWLDGPNCVDGAYEIALEYWNRISASAWIDIPDEPPILPSDESERWVLFEKGSDGRYDDIVFLPPAMSHLEWEQKYCGTALGDYVKKHVGRFYNRWLVGIDYKTKCDLNGLDLDRKFNTTDPSINYPTSYRIWFQREDGHREQFPGVYYPSLGIWKKKRLGEWIRIGRRIDYWLALEKSGAIQRDPARETRFRKLSGQIVSFVNGSGPEPEDDINLNGAIPQNEQAVIDRMIDDFVKQTVSGLMKSMFPVQFSTKNIPNTSESLNPANMKSTPL